MPTPFGEILRRAVRRTPNAVGGALAAGDGELVDMWTNWDEGDWAILTAHYGILVSHIRSALHTFHFGDVEFMFLSYDELEIVIQVVEDNYFAIIAATPPMHLNAAMQNIQDAAHGMLQEMI